MHYNAERPKLLLGAPLPLTGATRHTIRPRTHQARRRPSPRHTSTQAAARDQDSPSSVPSHRNQCTVKHGGFAYLSSFASHFSTFLDYEQVHTIAVTVAIKIHPRYEKHVQPSYCILQVHTVRSHLLMIHKINQALVRWGVWHQHKTVLFE